MVRAITANRHDFARITRAPLFVPAAVPIVLRIVRSVHRPAVALASMRDHAADAQQGSGAKHGNVEGRECT